jgi:hypothetical protein
MLNKSKYNKKLLKQQKPFKENIGKHKRVKSNINAIAHKMFPETLQSTTAGNTNANSKKMLKTVSKGYRIMSKKTAENSPLCTTQNQPSQITESSGRPPTASKIAKPSGHTKNSMSTHVKKKDNYFITKDDEFQNDLDEFPLQSSEMANQNRHSHHQNDAKAEGSSLFKYKEYKKMYFEDSKKKQPNKNIESNYATEQNKYKKLLTTHFKKCKLCLLTHSHHY